MSLTLIQQICIWALPVIFAITVHEAAHGWCAYQLGDPTAKLLGRVTLNPWVHIDPIGSILVPLVIGYLSHFQFIFGWAKPVPITYQNLKNKKRDISLVALAGPFSNLLMALFWAVSLKLSVSGALSSDLLKFIALSSKAGISINAILFALNILPIPPLDGSKVLSCLMPSHYAYHYDKLEPYGFMILIALSFSGVLSALISPLLSLLFTFLSLLLNI